MSKIQEELQEMTKLMNEKRLMTAGQVQALLKGILTILNEYKSDAKSINDDTRATVENLLEDVVTRHEELIDGFTDDIKKNNDDNQKKFDQSVSEIRAMMTAVQAMKPKDGVSPKIEDIVPKVLEAMPDAQEFEHESAGEIATKLETLEGEDRLDASAVKGIVELITSWFSKNKPEAQVFRINTNGGGVQSITSKDGSVIIKASGAKGKGVVDLSVSTGPGGGLSKETPTGTIDNANLTFIVAHTPFFINVNGGIYNVGDGAYASYNAGTITLAYPVGTGGFIKSYY